MSSAEARQDEYREDGHCHATTRLAATHVSSCHVAADVIAATAALVGG